MSSDEEYAEKEAQANPLIQEEEKKEDNSIVIRFGIYPNIKFKNEVISLPKDRIIK